MHGREFLLLAMDNSNASHLSSSRRRRHHGWQVIVLVALLVGIASLEITRLIKRKSQTRTAPTISGVSELSAASQKRFAQPQASQQAKLISAFKPPIIKDQIAWVHDYNGSLFIAHDGGRSWTPIGGDAPKKFSQFTMLDSYEGRAVADDAKVWKTDDAGNNWYEVGSLKPDDPDDLYHGASQILFTDRVHGWIVDTFNVWRSLDAGSSWQEVKPLNRPTSPVRQILMVNAHVGWAVCEGDVLKTEDGGARWRSVRASTALNQFTSIETLAAWDNSHACLAAKDAPLPYPENVVLCTHDGGTNWRQPTGFDDRFAIYSLFFVDNKMGWAAGGVADGFGSYFGRGVLFQTQDGGASWQQINSAPGDDALRSVRFSSSSEGWLASSYDVYHTSDSGLTWSKTLSYPEVKDRNRQIYYGSKDPSQTLISQK